MSRTGLACHQDGLWPKLGVWLPAGDGAGGPPQAWGLFGDGWGAVPSVTWPGSALRKACCGGGVERESTLSQMALPIRSDANFSTSLS